MPNTKYLFISIILGFLGTILLTLGCMIGFEIKDYENIGSINWLDFGTMFLGGSVGQILLLFLFLLL